MERPLRAQVTTALSGRWSSREVIRLLRLCVTRREMALADELARAVLQRRQVANEDLIEAAVALGDDQRHPLQLKLWERVGRGARIARWLRSSYVEGYFDALMAAGQTQQAKKVLERGIGWTAPGQRRALWERLVAWGQREGQLDLVLARLVQARDPDAAILAAKLQAERESADAATATLRKAFSKFPAHRPLQAALIKRLGAAGEREALKKTVAQVVRVNPSDPLPWLAYIDACIVARDVDLVQRTIDRLLKTYPRHDALIESLIDREQMLGDDHQRIRRLFEALLKAAPHRASHIESYADWLLGRGRSEKEAARRVLNKLLKIPQGRYEGLRKQAALLRNHSHLKEAEAILRQMSVEYPQRVETLRDLAKVLELTQRPVEAEKNWLRLTRIQGGESPQRRELAREGRRALTELYVRRGWHEERFKALTARLSSSQGELGDLLLWMDLRGLFLGSSAPLPAAKLHPALRGRASKDAEYLEVLAQRRMRERDLNGAERALVALESIDPRAARGGQLRLIELLTTTHQPKRAAALERRLLMKGQLSSRQLLKLAEQHLRRGQTDQGVHLIRQAAELSPHDTAPALRLAGVLRQLGRRRQEVLALQSVIVRAVDLQRIDAAGQRLITLAMMRGGALALLRWIDAVALKHPRRAAIERFRLLTYDAWLRSSKLAKALGEPQQSPPTSLVHEALGSPDLALKVRALRQVVITERSIPLAMGRRLLAHSNGTLRRLALAALANGGSTEASSLIASRAAEPSASERIARWIALARLPYTPEGAQSLLRGTRMRNRHEAAVAALGFGMRGGPDRLPALVQFGKKRRQLRDAAALALGVAMRGVPPEKAHDSLELLAQWAQAEGATSLQRAQAGALWAMAASAQPQATEALLKIIVRTDAPWKRHLALRLAGATSPPELKPRRWRRLSQSGGRGGLLVEIIDDTLEPWLSPSPASMRAAMKRLAPSLTARLGQAPSWQRRRFCHDLESYTALPSEYISTCALGEVASPSRRLR